MKRFLFFYLIHTVLLVNGQSLSLNTYGNPVNETIIFLHGGPGYNSVNFELSTANELSELGFFIVVYDRRGEGRESKKKSAFAFEQTIEDINQIYKELNIKKAHLFGHSFGGIIAVKFAEQYKNKVASILLISAPISIQRILQNIVDRSENIYKIKSDSTNLNYINYLKKLDKESLTYASYAFQHAILNGFYSTKELTKDSKRIYQKINNHKLFKQYASQSNFNAVRGFYESERYTSIDITKNIIKLKNNGIKIKGIYGNEDGLFIEQDIESLKRIIGKANVKYLYKSSHNVFIDQQEQFFQFIKSNVSHD